MKFNLWLETKTGTTIPLYHAHPDVHSLIKKGFSQNNIGSANTGLASVKVPGGREAYGASEGIHLTRSLDFAIHFSSRYKNGGVVEVFFNTRKPFYVPAYNTKAGKTHFRVFVDPEDKYLLPLAGNAPANLDRIATTILRMQTTKKVFEQEGNLGVLTSRQDMPLALQAKALAREFYMSPQGMHRHGWPPAYREINPVFNETPFATLGPHEWKQWADKGYLDSVWWGSGPGPFHGEEEVTVFDPRRLRIGSVVHEK